MTRGSVVDEIDSLLGIDAADERDVLAGELVRADFAWVDQLIARRKQLGLSQAEVARAMGRSQSVVSDIETMSTDPRLSTLRRYALAIGAAVRHRVFPHVALHPLVRAQSEGPVTAQSVSAGPGQSVCSHGFYVSVSANSHFEVGVR
jgi:DNA-binding XRE family transcriptional regulator